MECRYSGHRIQPALNRRLVLPGCLTRLFDRPGFGVRPVDELVVLGDARRMRNPADDLATVASVKPRRLDDFSLGVRPVESLFLVVDHQPGDFSDVGDDRLTPASIQARTLEAWLLPSVAPIQIPTTICEMLSF